MNKRPRLCKCCIFSVKIFIVISFTLLISIIAGEIYLREFSFYGIRYFIQLDNSKIKKDTVNELNFISIHSLDRLLKERKNIENEIVQNNANTYRVIVLGDSIAGGGLINWELAFPQILKKILQKSYPGINFEVLVCAAGGWSTPQEVSAYEKYCKELNPNLVILAYCENDTVECYQKMRKINGQLNLVFYETNIPYLSVVPFNRYFTEKLLIARFINEYFIKFLQWCHIPLGIKYCLISDEKIYQAFNRLHVLIQDTNASVLVVVFPRFDETAKLYNIRMPSLIQKWCMNLGFGYLDLLEKYERYGLEALKANPKDITHPNVFGHKIAAEEIAEKLQQMHLLGE